MPLAIARASFELEMRNTGITEMIEVPGRSHGPTIDRGWHEVADLSLAFIQRYTSPVTHNVSQKRSSL